MFFKDFHIQLLLMSKLKLVKFKFSATYSEYVAMFQLHSCNELGCIFSKLKCMTQPWDYSSVQRWLTLGSKGDEKKKDTL